MAKGGGGGDADKQAQYKELARQQAIQGGTVAIDDLFSKQFSPDFFAKRRQSYLDFANPQVDRQYEDARKQLAFSLARGGNTDSSAAEQQGADLFGKAGALRQGVADKALSFETGARGNIEDARSQLIQMLNQTGDATGAVNSARSRLAALSTPDSYSPLGDLFSTGLSAAGQQAALERADAASGGIVGPRFNTGLFAPNKSTAVIR